MYTAHSITAGRRQSLKLPSPYHAKPEQASNRPKREEIKRRVGIVVYNINRLIAYRDVSLRNDMPCIARHVHGSYFVNYCLHDNIVISL